MESIKLVGIQVILVCLIASSVAKSDNIIDNGSAQAVAHQSSNRDQLALPRIFDFSAFKSIFHKQYSSILEELIKQKIYLARAFSAFISTVRYKHYLSDFYEKVNEMSDWTLKDIKSIFIPVEIIRANTATNLAIANLNEPVYADIEAGLRDAREHQSQRSRKKRDVVLQNHAQLINLANDPSFQPNNTTPTKNNPGNNFFQKIVAGTNSFFDKVKLELIKMSKRDFGDVHKQLTGPDGQILPDEVFLDLRKRNCFAEPVFQGMCGCCYIMAVITLYEYAYCQTTSRFLSFSKQYPIDCGDRTGLFGCKGGNPADVGRFVAKYGVDLDQTYPYRMKHDECPYQADSDESTMGFMRVRSADLVKVRMHDWDQALRKGFPVQVNVWGHENFTTWGGGVDDGLRCRERSYGHCVVLVGSGRENGHEYWLFRNSWGVNWGEAGHWKLNKLANCYMEEWGYVTYANFYGQPERWLNDKYTGKEVQQRNKQYLEELSKVAPSSSVELPT